MSLPRIAIIIGGPSSEHDVSLASAKQIISAIRTDKFAYKPILVSRDNIWRVFPSDLALAAETAEIALTEQQIQNYLPFNFDAAFIAMHGEYGEDGTIQRLLDRAGIAYQGSGPRSSKLAFDKAASMQLLRRLGFHIPNYFVINRSDWVSSRGRKVYQLRAALGPKLVVKPNAAGSSIGVYITDTPAQLADAIEQVSLKYDRLIVQTFIAGSEITCGVIEFDDETIVLPPTLIQPTKAGGFFDYTAKYTPGASQEITPAPFKPAVLAAIQTTALKAHRALKCRDYSRTDMILGQGRLWVLEVNTLPGMTETSLIPQAAAALGVTFPDLVEHLFQRALHRPEVIELN